MNSESRVTNAQPLANERAATEQMKHASNAVPLSAKRSKIEAACNNYDIEALAGLASSEGGLVDDNCRRLAWPVLLGLEPGESDNLIIGPWQNDAAHRDEEQVQLDVNRAFVYYPHDQSQQQIDENKQRLSRVIKQTLRRHPSLCYFQGYHDIIQVFLLVLGEQLALKSAERLSLLRIRDFMLPSLSPAMKHIMLIPVLLQRVDPMLHRYLSGTKPFFALPSTLTLYAHDIQEYIDIARLFDFLLSHEPVMAIYFFVAIVLSRKKELLDIPLDEPEMLHFTLQKLPKTLDLDGLIKNALELYRQVPPEKLPQRAWNRISSLSVLKTARNISRKQSLEEGEEKLQQQERQLRRDESREKLYAILRRYRSPAMSVAIPFIIGVTALWLRRSGNDRFLWSYLRRPVH